jgi:spore coat protein U-like protein
MEFRRSRREFPWKSFSSFLFATAVFLPSAAQAGTSTSQVRVTLTVQAECKLTSTTDIAFGTAGVIQAAITGTGTIGVQCTNTTPYNIGLNVGAGTGATVAIRKMTSAAGGTIEYSLYRDAAFTQLWGDTIATNTLAATGNGAVQSFTINGRVPAQTTPAAGNYTDTVQVVVTY